MYVNGRLRDTAESKELIDEQDYEETSQEVVHKAEGVFLWVRLIVGLLAVGMDNGDTLHEICAKLNSLPSRLGPKMVFI